MRALRPYPELTELNQAFLDALFANIDASFRELGISDTRVPRKMRQAAEAFYGRLGAYEKSLNENGLEGVKAALQRNLYRDETPGDGTLDAMARYMIGSLGRLALTDDAAWQSGQLRFAQLDLRSGS
jgi:cytochrome b pre-mRNA-processing protein 3